MKNEQQEAYDRHIQKIWDVKDALYQAYLKSGCKTYVEFIQKQTKSEPKSYFIDHIPGRKVA